MKWHHHAGKKSLTALEKSQAVKQVIVQEFSNGQALVVKAFEEKCFAFRADAIGEFRHAGRCDMCSKQRNMENATGTDPFLKELLHMLIQDKGDPPGPALGPGGLGWAVKNREQLQVNFTADVERELDQLVKDLEQLGKCCNGAEKMPTGKHTMPPASQGFDSLLEGLRSILLNIRGVVVFLVEYSGSFVFRTEWAQALLHLFMRPEFEAALPALLEFLEIGCQYIHHKDHLINSWSSFLDMKKDMNKMFRGDEDRPPLLARDKGYYQLMQKNLNALGDSVCYTTGTGAVLFRRAHPTEEQKGTSLALVSKRMQMVCEVFLEACEAEHLMARGAALLLLHTTSSPWPPLTKTPSNEWPSCLSAK